MRAAFFGHFDCMRILLEGGADKEAVDRVRLSRMRSSIQPKNNMCALIIDCDSNPCIPSMDIFVCWPHNSTGALLYFSPPPVADPSVCVSFWMRGATFTTQIKCVA